MHNNHLSPTPLQISPYPTVPKISMACFVSQAQSHPLWAVNVEGMIVEVPAVVIEEIRTRPTHVMGWFSPRLEKAWKLIFPLTKVSEKLGFLPLSDPSWGNMPNPWWHFMTDVPGPQRGRAFRKYLRTKYYAKNTPRSLC